MSPTQDTSDPRQSGWLDRFGLIGTTPSFHLIYLVFLFFPWLFVTPSTVDIAIALLATAIFIPIHFYAYKADSGERVLPIAAVSGLGMATAFFTVGSGVFLVYCAAMSGFHRPVWRSGVIVGLCAIAYATASYVAGRPFVELGFITFMALIIWFSCLSNAQTLIDAERLERERELDTQAASLTERERIGRDLHDLLGHTLTMVALKSDLANRLIDSDPEQAKAQIQEIQQGARRALSDVRVALSGLSLVSIATELDNARRALASADVELRVTGRVPDLTPEQDKVCGLMIREAVTNIIRHTKATAAHIDFTASDEHSHVTVSDNGGGKVGIEGHGLNGLRLRIESLGGSVRITDENGVRLCASLPLIPA